MRVGCFDRNDKVVFAIVLCLATYVHNVMLKCYLLLDRTGKRRKQREAERHLAAGPAGRCAKTERILGTNLPKHSPKQPHRLELLYWRSHAEIDIVLGQELRYDHYRI